MNRLKEIKERLAAATPADKWEAYDPHDACCGSPCTVDGCHESHPCGVVAVSGPRVWDSAELRFEGPHAEADAALIAYAPSDLAWLIDENEKMADGWKRAIADGTSGGRLPESHIQHLACAAFHAEEITTAKLADLLGLNHDADNWCYMIWTQDRGRKPVDVSPYVVDPPESQRDEDKQDG